MSLSIIACAKEACEKNANTFNYRDNQCRLDDCPDGQYTLTDTLGGYDVYIYAGVETIDRFRKKYNLFIIVGLLILHFQHYCLKGCY